jgi:hypothetical protein
MLFKYTVKKARHYRASSSIIGMNFKMLYYIWLIGRKNLFPEPYLPLSCLCFQVLKVAPFATYIKHHSNIVHAGSLAHPLNIIHQIKHQTSNIVHASPLVHHIYIFYTSIRFGDLQLVHTMRKVVITFNNFGTIAFGMINLFGDN